MELGLGLTKIIPFLIYVISILVIIITVFKSMDIGLYFIAFLAPLVVLINKMIIYPGGRNVIDFIVLALIISWILNKNGFEKTPLNKPILILIIVSFAGVIMATNLSGENIINEYLKSWKNFIMLPITYLIFVNNVKDKKKVMIIVLLMFFVMLLVDRNFYHEFRWKNKEHFDYKGRIGGFIYLGPNELATFAVQYSMVLIGILINDKGHKIMRIFLYLVLASNIYVVLYSYSRASYSAAMVGLLFLGLVKRNIKLIIILMLLFTSWKFILPTPVVERISGTVLEDGTLESSAQGRINLWQLSIPVIQSNPLGIGFDRSRSIIKADPHNMYIKMLMELGPQGLLIYLYLYLISFIQGMRLYFSHDDSVFRGLGLGFSACVLANMVCNFTGHSWFLYPINVYYWILLALIVRLNLENSKNIMPHRSMSITYDSKLIWS